MDQFLSPDFCLDAALTDLRQVFFAAQQKILAYFSGNMDFYLICLLFRRTSKMGIQLLRIETTPIKEPVGP